MQLNGIPIFSLPSPQIHSLISLIHFNLPMVSPKVSAPFILGELAGLSDFWIMVLKHGYIVEPTSADSTFQNGLAKYPHHTLVQLMRCILSDAGLVSSY